MTIKPCPNPECRGPGRLDKSKGGAAHWVECGSACGVEGPSAGHAEKAVALWNNLPREVEWVTLTGTPADALPRVGQICDVALADDTVRVALECQPYWEDDSHRYSVPFVIAWRPHTPPRGPKR
jgi:hypothetical protein